MDRNKVKMIKNIITRIAIVSALSLCLVACGKKEDVAVTPQPQDEMHDVDVRKEQTAQEDIQEATVVTVEDSVVEDIQEQEENTGEETEQSVEQGEPELSENEKNPTIVWLGDSLTQGSLGDEYDNLIGAPCVILMNNYNLNVEGYGFYGNNTGAVLWRYTDETQENQVRDPAKVYIFWLGSNDWVIDGQPNTDAESVITRLDDFISYGKIDKYIIMGTTARYELRVQESGKPMYEIINDKLENHYKNHYMDVIDIIGDDGYGPDEIHLKAKTYEDVAQMVYNKLIEMGYIK